MRIRVPTVDVLRSGRSEVVDRQGLMQGGEAGWAGPMELVGQGGRAIDQAQLLSRKRIRRQMVIVAYHRELGPAQTAFSHVVGLTMKPLTWQSDRTALDLTQPVNSNPVPSEAYLQQWDAMEGKGAVDPRKGKKTGFGFWT